MKGLPMDSPDVEEPYTICLLNKATKIITSPNIFVSKFPPGLMVLNFSILETSVTFPQLLEAYVIPLHNPMGFHQ